VRASATTSRMALAPTSTTAMGRGASTGAGAAGGGTDWRNLLRGLANEISHVILTIEDPCSDPVALR